MWINGIPDETEQLDSEPEAIFNQGFGHVIAYRTAMGFPIGNGIDILKVKVALRSLFASDPRTLPSNFKSAEARSTPNAAVMANNAAQVFFMHYLAALHKMPVTEVAAIFAEKYSVEFDALINTPSDTAEAANDTPVEKPTTLTRQATFGTLAAA